MNTVSYFIILLSLICYHLFVSCRFVAQTEFEVDFRPVEELLHRSVQICPENCKKELTSECRCLWEPQKMDSCDDYQCIEYGLKELNVVCDENNPVTHNICRVLRTLEDIVYNKKTLCEQPLALRPFLEHIKREYQKSNS